MHEDDAMVVVGVDGSPGSVTALRWAANRADTLGEVRPVHSWAYPWWSVAPTPIGAGTAPPAELMDRIGYETVEQAVGDLAGVGPAVVREGRASHVLLDESDDAALLVVGTRGRSALADRLLGSVSNAVVGRATTSVVVVPGDTETERGPEHIVVGLDGSDNAARALGWALRYATDPGDRIDAIVAWDAPTLDVDNAIIREPREAEAHARALAQAAVAAADAPHGHPEVTIRTERGDARRVLQSAGADADLLVVGARGHTGFAELVLGSVASALAHQPPCALAVIR